MAGRQKMHVIRVFNSSQTPQWSSHPEKSLTLEEAQVSFEKLRASIESDPNIEDNKTRVELAIWFNGAKLQSWQNFAKEAAPRTPAAPRQSVPKGSADPAARLFTYSVKGTPGDVAAQVVAPNEKAANRFLAASAFNLDMSTLEVSEGDRPETNPGFTRMEYLHAELIPKNPLPAATTQPAEAAAE